MKTLFRALTVVSTLGALIAMPLTASAVNKTWASFIIAPTSASVAAGIATNISAVETAANGSGASGRYAGPATLTTTISPAEPTITVTPNPVVLTFPSTSATLMSTVTVATATSTPVGTYVVSIVINTNPANANVTPVTNTFTLNVGAVFIPLKVWSPAGVTTNWSTGTNWTAIGAPVSSNDVDFVDLGATNTAGTVDNVADSSQVIGSLTYGQTNGFHTTLINPGVTLTIGATANGLAVGTGSDIGDGQLTTAAITGGGGTLSVTNTGSLVYINQSHNVSSPAIAQAQATLDLSGLDKFTATVSRVLVGADTTASLKGASGVLKLARTNSINVTAGSAAPQLDIGDNTQANGAQAIASSLLLGQTNGIFADTISVGTGKTDNTGASMAFNSSFTSPSAYFRGTNGSASRVGTWTIGDGVTSKAAVAIGTCDFSLGTVDALVNTMYIGKGATAATQAVPGTGTLTLNAGTIDVNTMEVGFNINASGTGTVNVNGGSLKVNSLLELGHAGGSGTLNVSGGTTILSAGVTPGAGTSTINLTGGTTTMTNGSATLGTVATPVSTLLIANATLNLAASSLGATIDASTLNGGGLANVLNFSSVPSLTNVPAQFPVIKYASSSGDLTTFVLGTLPGTYQGYISNNTANSSIDLVLTNGPVFPVMVWDGAHSADWDTFTLNWKTNGFLSAFQQNYPVVQFDDTLTGSTNVNLTTSLTPGSIIVNNTASNYVFTGVGSLSGSLTLLKEGAGALTLAESGVDNFSGGIAVNGGTMILDNANGNLSGSTTINGGTLQVGKNDANGSLPSGGVALAGELDFNRANSVNVTNVISGSGTMSQIGTGLTTLSGNSSFNGTVAVTQGTLQMGSTNGIGQSASVTVSNGTFDVNGFALFGNGNTTLNINVQGAGVGGNGAIVNTGVSQTKVFHTVTLSGDTTFGGNGDWDIRNNTGNSAGTDGQLNGAFNLTKVGTNTVQLRGVAIDSGLENINVEGGTFTVTGSATAIISSLGDPSATITVFSNATLVLDTIGNIPSKNFALTNGGSLRSSATNTFGNPLTLTGAANNIITVNGGTSLLTVTSVINGPGGMSKNGSSVLFLGASNTYSGGTVVSGGTLALYGGGSDGAINASTNINVTSGATLDVSGRVDQTFTLVSGQTLSGGAGTNGPGTINGKLIVNPGAVLAPGTGTTNTGTLTVSSNATLQGMTIMKLDPSTNANDQLSAYGITYGGSLIVTNISGTPTNGQKFQLFSASNGVYNAGSFSSITLPSTAGLTWTTNLTVDGSITASTALPTPATPYITSVSLSGTTLIINGTNGTSGRQFEVLASTNITLPLSNWTSIATNTFSTGNFSVTNTVNSTVPRSFYVVRIP